MADWGSERIKTLEAAAGEHSQEELAWTTSRAECLCSADSRRAPPRGVRVGGTTVLSQALVRDSIGPLTASGDSSATGAVTTRYHYDAPDRRDRVRRDGETAQAFTYDLAGNRVSTTSAARDRHGNLRGRRSDPDVRRHRDHARCGGGAADGAAGRDSLRRPMRMTIAFYQSMDGRLRMMGPVRDSPN